MAEYRLLELAKAMKGQILQGSPTLKFSSFNIDSRLSSPGELFFAIQAQRDGHDFIPHAVQKGAAGAVISRRVHPPDGTTALIHVDDTLKALQRLAKYTLKNSAAQVVGITGSAGKTTTKEFTAQLLSRKFRVLKSAGNFNNHLGLPLSLLKLNGTHKISVLEYGMSAKGEISALTRIASPDVAVITNILPVHLEFFKNTKEIARAKQEILKGMSPQGTAVLNGDDALVKDISEGGRGRTIYFGLSENHNIHARNLVNRGWDGFSFDLVYGSESKPTVLPFFNLSYLYNFLAAAAVAWIFRIPIEEVVDCALSLQLLSNRGRIFRGIGATTVIDDSYNSNPEALENALQALKSLPGGRKIAILGDMLELGETEIEYHRKAGKAAAELGLDVLVTIGSLARHIAESAVENGMDSRAVVSFPDSQKAAGEISSLIKPGDKILIKGSRGVKMEIISNRIKEKEQNFA